MQVRKILQINVAVSLLMTLAVVLMIFLSLYRVKDAMEKSGIADEILNSAFERSTFRSDYLQNSNERAKVQWFAKNEEVGKILKSASERFRQAEDKKIIGEMIEDQERTEKIFSAVVENREKIKPDRESAELSEEMEKRLVSQLNMRLYAKGLYVRKLHESARNHLLSTVRLTGLGIIFVLALITAAVMINSWEMSRTIATRIRRLQKGVSVIGEGNLDYRIDVKGDDEFADLSGSFNKMTEKLQRSHRDLESEIAERRQTEELLWENEARLKRSQEIAHLGSWELDVVKNILTWSDEVYRIFGLRPREFEATYETFLEAVHPEDREAVDEAYSGSLGEGRDSYEIEHRIVRKSTKEIRYVHEKCEHTRDESGRIVRSAGMVHDITERRRAEEERERALSVAENRTVELEIAMKELEGFTYSVSHDLRAPIRHIVSSAELLKTESWADLNEEGRQFLSYIMAASKKLGVLIDELLEFSRMGRATMLETAVDLDRLAREVVGSLGKDASSREIEWEVGTLPEVYGDPSMLRIVFINLISNAVKFTGTRSRAKIAIGHIDGEGEHVIYVKDNGIGFDMKYSDKLFKVFERLSSEFEGTGIGLANVERIIRRHGGRVWAEGKVDSGATFYFALPKKKNE